MTIRALIVITAAIALLLTVASHAKDNNPFSGATSISVAMTREEVVKSTGNSDLVAHEQKQPETCTASQYGIGDGYHGKRTASGAIFNTHSLTAAHRSRPFGSSVVVTNLGNGRTVTVRINDRGPFVRGRCIDLSRAAANAIGMGGLARVRVE